MSTATAASNPIITAWNAVSPFGIGREAFAEGLRAGRPTAAPVDKEEWKVPDETACLVPGFVLSEVLGKKGTRSMDRVSGLAVATVGQLLSGFEAGKLPIAGEDIAVVLGTTTGSAESMMSITRDSFVNEKPFYIDPSRLPNAVMNCAAAQCAIWHQLKGPNVTVAGGRTSGLFSLNYARRLMDTGRAKVVLCGSAEEYSYARSWLDWHTRGEDEGDTTLGEGCAVLQLEPGDAESADRPALAEVLVVKVGVYPTDDPRPSLTACVREALDRAGVAAQDVWAVAPCEPFGRAGLYEQEVLDEVFAGASPTVIRHRALIGDTAAAAASFQIAAVLSHAEQDPLASGQVVLITSIDRDGVLGCALLRLR